MLKEFRPALRFLFIFLGLYLGGNILYGIYVEAYKPDPDPVTRLVSFQTAKTLNVLGYGVEPVRNPNGPTVYLIQDDKKILNIFEGCNGINVMIVMIAFLAAFGGNGKKMRWFLPLSILIIHVTNIARIVLLYFVAVGYHHYFYYVHKYVFTAVIYLIVVLLWIIWVAKINEKPKTTAPA